MSNKYSIKDACQMIADKAGLPKALHTNTLLNYRTKFKDELSETSNPAYTGPVALTDDDINFIAIEMSKNLKTIAKRKQKQVSPKPTSPNAVLSGLEAQTKQNADKIDVIEGQLEQITLNELADLHGIINDQQDEIEKLNKQVNILMGAYEMQQRQIATLQAVNIAVHVSEISQKLDKLLNQKQILISR